MKTPTENLTCKSCGLQVMQLAEHPRWKGVPMGPNSAELQWYCREKEPCELAFRQAIQKAERAWSRG